MRSGRNLSDDFTRSDSEATPSLVRSATRLGAEALQLAGILDQDDAICGLGDFGQERIGERRLSGRRTAGNQDVFSFLDGKAQHIGVPLRHDPGGDVIGKREDGDGRLSDGESWCGDDRRQQSLEALTGFR